MRPSPSFRQLTLLVAGNLALAALYFALARFGLAYPLLDRFVSLIWPAAGLSVAATILFGPIVLPGIILGAFAATVPSALGFLPALCLSLGNALAAYAGAEGRDLPQSRGRL